MGARDIGRVFTWLCFLCRIREEALSESERWNYGIGDLWKAGKLIIVMLHCKIQADKKHTTGASLVVQRLKIHLPVQGHGLDSWSKKIPHAAGQLSPWAATTEVCASRACAPLPREANTGRSPHNAMESSPCPQDKVCYMSRQIKPESSSEDSVQQNKNKNP